MIDILTSAAVDLADYQSKQVLGAGYFRLNPRLPRPIGLDDVAAVDELIGVADSIKLPHKPWEKSVLEECTAFLNAHW